MKNQAWQLKYIKATSNQFINNQPYSNQFDDVYFNDEGGLDEARHVFLKQNNLLQRWNQATEQKHFCIAETGLGTGLNFLTTLQAWQTTSLKPKNLHFISFEKYPLSYKDMEMAHQCFPELQTYSQQLLSIWQAFKTQFRSGFHHFRLSDDVKLSLAFGDATDNLTQLQASIDAWYLDGFAPSKNPAMWQDNLFAEVNRLSSFGTTLATFTAATQVRKTLEKNGFEVSKKPGFGKKREMITAVFKQKNTTTNNQHQWDPKPQSDSINKSVTLVGGGIAGMCLAHYFKQAGYQVTVIDQNSKPMQAASGNDLAMVMPLLTAQYSPESAFYIRAFEKAVRFYQDNEYLAVGVEQFLPQTKQQKWSQAIQKSDLPQELIEIRTDLSALYPQAGYVKTQLLAERLKLNVDQWITAEVVSLKQSEAGLWHTFNDQGTEINQSELLIVTNGISAQQLLQPHDLYLTAKHGMTTSVQAPKDQKLKHIQLADGYIIPFKDQKQWLCGATFDHLDQSLWYQTAQLYSNHSERNFQLWQGHPLYDDLINAPILNGHAAIRATTNDHLPICGPIIDQNQFKLDYQDLHHGRHWQTYPPAVGINNLYVLNGLGSRGFTSAPLLAEYLSAMILSEPLPLEADLCKIIHPNRFLYRSLKKRQLDDNHQY